MPEKLATNDLPAIVEMLKKQDSIKWGILNRGEKGHNFKIFLDGFERIVRERYGDDESLLDIDGEKLFFLIKEYGFPEETILNLADCAFHSNDKALFYKLISVVFANAEKFSDQSMVATAQHDLASWKDSREKNPEQAIKLNKEVIAMTKGSPDEALQNLAEKARFGLTAQNKDLKPSAKAKGFSEMIKRFEKLGNSADAIRAKGEAAKAYLELARRQLGQSERPDNLELAKELALEALKQSLDLGYINAEKYARKYLAEIYDEMGDKKKADSYRKKAGELAERY